MASIASSNPALASQKRIPGIRGGQPEKAVLATLGSILPGPGNRMQFYQAIP